MSEIVLVTQPELSKGEEAFFNAPSLEIRPAPPEEALLAEAVRAARCRAVIVGIESYRGPLYEALGETGESRGALIARFGVGHDSINKALARKHQILVTNTPGALDESVAEHAIWLLGSLARRVAACHRRLRAGQFTAEVGDEVYGRTLGLLGCGAIGRRVAAIAHFGFRMNVLAADCRPAETLERMYGRTIQKIEREWGLGRYTTDVAAVLRQADFLSLHLPSNSGTRHFIDAARLAQMKPGAMLINTARGVIVDELALYDALAAGRLAGAALDVFETEPYCPVQPDKDLRMLENVVLTPHVASNTHAANHRMAKICLANVTNFFLGRLDNLTQVN